jgi:hypothetical protein
MIKPDAGSVLATTKELFAEYRRFTRKFKVDPKSYRIDPYILKDVATHYWRDVERLHSFHDMPLIDSRKIAGYLTYWICKLHPIGATNTFAYLADPQKPKYINEAFAVSVACGRINAALEASGYKVGIVMDSKTLDSLLYTLKYRATSGDTLTLFFEMVEKLALKSNNQNL